MAEALTADRKKKTWICSECGKQHVERSAVKSNRADGKGGGYLCLQACGMQEGKRVRKEKRPRDAGAQAEHKAHKP